MAQASSGKKVLLATRPLIPPWDEASKNFAYFLGRSITQHHLTLLGEGSLEGLPESTKVDKIFRGPHLGLANKIRLLFYLRSHRHDFDIVHYLFTPTKQNSQFIKRFALPKKATKTVQTVATVRDDLYTAEELKAMFFANELVTYTDAAKDKLGRLGFTNVTRIYPGIDLDRFSPGPKDEKLLASFGFNSKHFLIIYPGEFIRLGVTDLLADMWLHYFKAHPETNIRFAFTCRIKNEADRKKRDEIKKRFRDAGLLDYVAFPKPIHDMPPLYRSADLIIFPVTNLAGKFDVPLIIIEAYATKKPVILSDLEAFGEFSDPSFCATVETGSASSLIKKILYLKENPAVSDTLGKAAREFVEANFDLKDTARQYSELYSSL